MASYTILKNTSLLIDLPSDMAEQGWLVSDTIAYHEGCNSGYIEKVFNLSSSTTWTFTYTILSMTSGSINIVVGGNVGISRTAPGTYSETFTITGSSVLVRFFSTGVNSLQLLQIYSPLQNTSSRTLLFNEDANKWVGDQSAHPEMMSKFINDFFMFDHGRMWICNSDEVPRNNFFGVQYTSQIVFYCNLNPTEVKLFHSMRQKSNKVWSVPDITIFPYYGKPNGQKSRLKKGRFKSKQGDFFADFLRDLSDPRFTSNLDALLNGAKLQGSVMKITIENDDITEVRLLSIDITVSKSEYTY